MQKRNKDMEEQEGCGHSRLGGLAPSIDDFEILKPISRGAFGKVFLCHRKDQMDKKLAVKVMKKSVMIQKNMVDQVIAERNAAAITKSPFCVGLLYCLQTTNNVFLVMEYMIGGDLKSLLGVYGYFPEEQAVFYLAECVLALQYLHNHGIVHRDIKPDNMLLDARGHLKLTDFGLSTTGLRDRELHVADLLAKTPWPAGGGKKVRSCLVRTPGQIMSLTSHLSFSSVEGGDSTSMDSIGGSYGYVRNVDNSSHITMSDKAQSRTTSRMSELTDNKSNLISGSFTSHNPVQETPDGSRQAIKLSTPAASGRGRLLRKNSFTEAMAKHTKEQEKEMLRRKVLEKVVRSPVRQEVDSNLDTSPNSSRLQDLPNSSLDLGHDRTIEFDNNEIFHNDDKENSPPILDLCLDPNIPLSPMIDQESRDSFSSSPKPSLYLSHKKLDLSPVHPSPVRRFSFMSQEAYMISSANSHETSSRTHYVVPPVDKVTPVTHHQTPAMGRSSSVACENMRFLRDIEISSPEKFRSGEYFDSDVHLDCSDVKSSESRSESSTSPPPVTNISQQEQDVFDQEDSDHDMSQFKLPTDMSSSRKRKCSENTEDQPKSSGLTADLTDLVLSNKRSKTEEERSSTSSTSSEEEGPGYGYSTPVQLHTKDLLSALPNHMKDLTSKGFKAVKFISPAGLTPVQPPDKNYRPLSLADLEGESLEIETPPPTVPTTPTSQSRVPPTPYRTPKSVMRPGGRQISIANTRILGTPDYLAPELLLRQGHSLAVDWWALGVCLYEFMIGIPPFSDSTPELVFNNILNMSLEWPEGDESLSDNAVSAILSLLTVDPVNRSNGDTLQSHPLTKGVDWVNILDQVPPFVPNPDDATDTTYFSTRNNMQGLTVSGIDL